MQLVQLDTLRFKDLESGIPLYAIIRVARGKIRKRPICTVVISDHESVKWTLGQMWDGDSKATVRRCG